LENDKNIDSFKGMEVFIEDDSDESLKIFEGEEQAIKKRIKDVKKSIHLHHMIPVFELQDALSLPEFKPLTLEKYELFLFLKAGNYHFISVTREQHAILHDIRYQLYQKGGDKGGAGLLRGQSDEVTRMNAIAGGKAVALINKALKRGFSDPVLQAELSRRNQNSPGFKERSAKVGREGKRKPKQDVGEDVSPLRLEIRRQTAAINGNAQANNLKITRYHEIDAYYDKKFVIRLTGCSNGTDILKQLKSLPNADQYDFPDKKWKHAFGIATRFKDLPVNEQLQKRVENGWNLVILPLKEEYESLANELMKDKPVSRAERAVNAITEADTLIVYYKDEKVGEVTGCKTHGEVRLQIIEKFIKPFPELNRRAPDTCGRMLEDAYKRKLENVVPDLVYRIRVRSQGWGLDIL
jgi:hypothetical protein